MTTHPMTGVTNSKHKNLIANIFSSWPMCYLARRHYKYLMLFGIQNIFVYANTTREISSKKSDSRIECERSRSSVEVAQFLIIGKNI
jgi:hypothetical protein